MKRITREGRQGDLYFRKINQIPKEAIESEDLVLAKGEATGHSHRLVVSKQGTVQVFRDPESADQYISLKEETIVQHEKHGITVLAPGLWLVRRQRQFSPTGERLVQD